MSETEIGVLKKELGHLGDIVTKALYEKSYLLSEEFIEQLESAYEIINKEIIRLEQEDWYQNERI